MAYDKSKNPFFVEEDDNQSFSSKRITSSGGSRTETMNDKPRWEGGRDPFLEDDDGFGSSRPLSRHEQLQQQKQASMNRQLEGTNKILSSIYDSERMGIATAEELVHQGEQLDNVENKLDAINTDLKTSQRHLNGIKSVFGSIKNWWSGPPKETVPEKRPPRRPENSLGASIEASSSSVPSSRTNHPGLRSTQGFYEDDEYNQPRQTQDQKNMSDSRKQYEDQLDQNLDEMSLGLSRLKALGMGLGEEISAQNDQIDRITNKTDRADITIKDQNRQMRGVLGK